MVRGGRAFAALAALVAVGLLAGCSSASAGTGDGTSGYISGDGSTAIVSASQRGSAVEVSGTTLDGARLDLASMRGKVVVVNFWSSWCPPCRAEAASLQRGYQDLHPRGVDFVGVVSAGKDSLDNAKAFERKFAQSYPSIYDADNSVLLAFHGQLSPAAIPTTLVLDRQGRVAARALDAVDYSRLLGLVEPVLAEHG
jgi:thiol-disulfide isomerase/thioredoxin